VYCLNDINLCYVSSQKPLLICWKLVVDKDNPSEYETFFSTDVSLRAEQIIEWFVLCWIIVVTFEEVRKHLGVETRLLQNPYDAAPRILEAIFALDPSGSQSLPQEK
jgi:hypothetical protein